MANSYTFSILLPIYHDHLKNTHGDFYFGRSLACALQSLGHSTRIFAGEHWEETRADDIALVIRGRKAPAKKYGKLLLEWCISFPPRLDTGEYSMVDHFFAGSPLLHRRIRRMVPTGRASVMYQAFDCGVMYAEDISKTNDLIFVGSPRSKERRPVVSYAVQSGFRTRIWGSGWEDTDARSLQAGGHVDNVDLGMIYRSGTVVLNDHLVVMKRNGITSNRVFDGLACGRAVLTDTTAGLPPDLLPFVYGYNDAVSFRDQAERALSETEERRRQRILFAHQMRQRHSFDQRALQICSQVEKLLAIAG